EASHVDGPSRVVDARGSGDVEGHLVRLGDPQAAREVRTIGPRLVEQRGVNRRDVEPPRRRYRMEAHGKVVRRGKREALNAGAGGPSLDPAASEELAPGFVERGIVPVDVAHVDPRADDVAEAHPGVSEQGLGDTEHVVRFLEYVFPRTVD